MLKLDFYESGDGETIILTFPNGGVGIVDAHPSPYLDRPAIMDLVRGRVVHFVCLTHPHRDHGIDLIPVLEQHPNIKSFWHTVDDVKVLVFLQQENMKYPNYPSACREAVDRMKRGWAEFLIDLYAAVVTQKIPRHQLRSDQRPQVIDDVEITVLSPEETIIQRFVHAHSERLRDFKVTLPDTNLLSAILAVKYGGVVVLLGADALKENWKSATKLFFDLKLPKASILKVPHHGAANALLRNPSGHDHNYLDICTASAKSVLFAGDAKHPDPEVFRHLRARTDLICLSNGLKDGVPGANPLGINLLGARATTLPPVCNPVVSFTVGPDGVINQTAGNCKKKCVVATP